MAHLHTGSRAAPWEYVTLVLCRDVYHCTPLDLAEQPWSIVQTHLELLNVEAQVIEHKQKAATQRAKSRSKR